LKSILTAGIYFERYLEIINSDMVEPVHREKDSTRVHAGWLVIENLSFAYTGAHHDLFQDCNASFAPGFVTALIGANGSGKSTLFRLILACHPYYQGVIGLGGHDIRNIDRGSLRRSIGFLDQNNAIIDGTLAENLRLFHPAASTDEMLEACYAVRLDEFFTPRELLTTRLGEGGVFFSGGMARRVNIARLFLGHHDYLLLDEPFVGLHEDVQKGILFHLRQRFAHAVIIMSTHDAKLVRMSDQVCEIVNRRLNMRSSIVPMASEHTGRHTPSEYSTPRSNTPGCKADSAK
jgi:ABC-type transport system involved in cytochrome bd biosynthesis fused ATPase/permease subunit